MNHHRPVLKMHHILTDIISSEKTFHVEKISLLLLWFDEFFVSVFLGELYRRRDPWYHGQEAQYPKHVGYCSRRPRQIYPDRFPFVQSWYYCWSKSWWNQSYRHQKRRAGEMYYHQIHVSFWKDPKSESIKKILWNWCIWFMLMTVSRDF